MDLEIRHLRVISAIAEAGSISRAAATLGYTQPALTAQLQRIERALGGLLFARDGTGTRPTALGKVALTHAGNLLAMHRDLMRDVHRRDPADTETTAVRLGSTPGPLTAIMVTVAHGLLPGTDVSLHPNETEEEQVELLAEGRLEFGLGVDYPGYELPLPPGLSEAVLAVAPVFVLIAQDHPLADRAEVPLEALAGEQWLTGEGRDVRMRNQFRDACRRAGFAPRRVQRMNSAVVFPLIGQGHAVSLAHALTPERANVVVRPLAGDPMWARQRLIWPTANPAARVAPHLRDALVEAYENEAKRSPAYREWLSRRSTPL
jgi:DNA-binding transcriptional LysR family regulator